MSNKAAVRRYRGLFAKRGRATRRFVVWREGEPQPAADPGVTVIHVSSRVDQALGHLLDLPARRAAPTYHRRTPQEVLDGEEGPAIWRTVLERLLVEAETAEAQRALRTALDELKPEALAEASEDAPARQEAAQEASGQELVRPATKDEPRPTMFERGIRAAADVLVRDRSHHNLMNATFISMATGRPTGLRAEVERFRRAEGPESDALRDALQGLDDNAAAGRSGPTSDTEE